MAGLVGSQDYWIVGSRFFFEPNLAGTTTRSGEMIDLGTVDTISPQIATNIAELKDSESGVIRLVDQGLVSIDETYSITVKNFNFRNLQILFAGKPQAETQAANLVPASITLSSEELSRTPSGATGNLIKPTGGYLLVQLRDSSGNPLRNFTTASTLSLTANVATGGAAAALTKESHWTWWDAPKGIIRIIFLPTGGGGYPGMTVVSGVITVYPAAGFTITFSAATGAGYTGDRVIYPQSATLSDLTGNAHIYWTRNNGQDVSARTFACQIQPAGSSLTTDDYSSWTLTATALATGSTTEIAGRYTNIKWNNTTTGDNVGLLPNGNPAYNENYDGAGGGQSQSGWDKTPNDFELGGSLGGGKA
jgi:hypothetical protein